MVAELATVPAVAMVSLITSQKIQTKPLQYCPDPETMTELNGGSGKYCPFYRCAFGDLSLLHLKGKKRHSIYMYRYSGQHMGLIMWLSIDK